MILFLLFLIMTFSFSSNLILVGIYHWWSIIATLVILQSTFTTIMTVAPGWLHTPPAVLTVNIGPAIFAGTCSTLVTVFVSSVSPHSALGTQIVVGRGELELIETDVSEESHQTALFLHLTTLRSKLRVILVTESVVTHLQTRVNWDDLSLHEVWIHPNNLHCGQWQHIWIINSLLL